LLEHPPRLPAPNQSHDEHQNQQRGHHSKAPASQERG
jgi:hypothetical protein